MNAALSKETVHSHVDKSLSKAAKGSWPSICDRCLPNRQLLFARTTQFPDGSFRWLLAQPQSTLLELLAYCTARSVNAPAGRGAQERRGGGVLRKQAGGHAIVPSPLRRTLPADAIKDSTKKAATPLIDPSSIVQSRRPGRRLFCLSKLQC